MGAFDAFEPDSDVLRRFDRPVHFALGARGNPDLYARMAERLAGNFSGFTLDVFEDRHHVDTRPTEWNRRGSLRPCVNSGHVPRLSYEAATDVPPDQRHDPTR